MMLSDGDERLVDQARKGHQGGFSELVRRHEGAVYSLCYRMTGDAVEAEDLAQEAFLRFYRSLDKFRAGAPPRPWLRRIAANVCLDALRKRKEATLPLDGQVEGESQLRVHRRDELPEDAYLSREARRDVQSALLRLPADYRVVLALRYLEELSYQEVADALGVPVSTVETRLFRAKKMLARAINAPEDEKREKEARYELRLEGRAGL